VWWRTRLTGLVAASLCTPTFAQLNSVPPWDYSQLDRLSVQAQALIEREQPSAGYALYEEILFLIRVEKGLYSTDQVPYLLEHMQWSKRIGDWDQAMDTGNRLRWLLGRNENQIDNYRRLLLVHIHIPEDMTCIERHSDSGRFIKSASRCEAFRYFMADTYISATEIQQKVATQSNNTEDWEALENLAGLTAEMVFWVDGPPVILEIRGNEFYRTANPEIRQRYQPATWLRLAKTVEGKK